MSVLPAGNTCAKKSVLVRQTQWACLGMSHTRSRRA
jgi:hypothetical protein